MEVYHNPRCRKSREAIAFLEEKGESFDTVLYMSEALKKEELTAVIEKLGISASKLVRKTEPQFKEHFKGKDLSDAEWIDAMIEYPRLMQRPIVVKGSDAVVARPVENILPLL